MNFLNIILLPVKLCAITVGVQKNLRAFTDLGLRSLWTPNSYVVQRRHWALPPKPYLIVSLLAAVGNERHSSWWFLALLLWMLINGAPTEGHKFMLSL